MASVYDRSDIYDLFDSPKKDDMTKAHWEAVLSGLSVRTALDVSIGTGSLTLPLAALGVSLYGSDLSETMLARCREKAAGLLDRAKRSGRYAHILCIDEDSTRNNPKKPWPLKEKIWR